MLHHDLLFPQKMGSKSKGRHQKVICYRAVDETCELYLKEGKEIKMWSTPSIFPDLLASLESLASGWPVYSCWSWYLALQDEWGVRLEKHICMNHWRWGREEKRPQDVIYYRVRSKTGDCIWQVGERGEYLQLGSMLSWWEWSLCSQGMPARVVDWNEAMGTLMHCCSVFFFSWKNITWKVITLPWDRLQEWLIEDGIEKFLHLWMLWHI